MAELDSDDTLLARWLSGELTDAERQELESREDFPTLQRLAEASAQLQPPPFDADQAWNRLRATVEETPRKKAAPNWRLYGIAATVALLLGVYFFYPRDATHTTLAGEQKMVTLPDGSTAMLNAGSTLSFRPSNWPNVRELDLQGEAYFNVKPGSTFKVATDNGSVTVLGTTFNVRQRADRLWVHCYTGKVAIAAGAAVRDTLRPGEALHLHNGRTVDRNEGGNLDQRPAWMRGESQFRGVPLTLVVDELERQYGLSVQRGTVDLTASYTGSFPHNDLAVALRVVFDPMRIAYTREGGKTVILSPSPIP